MRILATCLALAAFSVPVAFGQSAASTAAAMPACAGVLTMIRVSEITPAGSMDKFMEAVAAQKAWYAKNSPADMIFASKILVRDAATGVSSYSDKTVISYHFYGTNTMTPPKRDAGYDAFVKLFGETSTIKESTLTCIPQAMVPMVM
jgi:hypothetical protein